MTAAKQISDESLSSDSNMKNRRKTFLVDPPFQKFFIKYTISIAVAVSIFYFAAIQIFFMNFRAKGTDMGLSPNHIFFSFLGEQRMYLDITFAVTTFIMAVCIFAYGLTLSNRVAGPLYRIKTDLRNFRSSGKIREIEFREKDFFADLAQEINLSIQHQSQSKK